MENNSVRSVWRIDCRRLGLIKQDRSAFSFFVVTERISTEKKVHELAKIAYSEDWWKDALILDIVELGTVHVLDGECLYVNDD